MKFSKNCGRILERIPADRVLGRGLTLCGAPRGQGSSASLWGRTGERLDGSQHPGVDSSRPGPSSTSSLLGVEEGGQGLYWVGLLGEPRSSRSESIIRWTLSRLLSPSSAFPFLLCQGAFILGSWGQPLKASVCLTSSPKLNTTTSISALNREVFLKK